MSTETAFSAFLRWASVHFWRSLGLVGYGAVPVSVSNTVTIVYVFGSWVSLVYRTGLMVPPLSVVSFASILRAEAQADKNFDCQIM